VGEPEGKNHLVDPGTDETKKLQSSGSGMGGGMDWIDLPRIGAGGRLL
jgi:hypothetical protein